MNNTVKATISAGELSVSPSVSGGVSITAAEDKKSGVRFLNSAHALMPKTAE